MHSRSRVCMLCTKSGSKLFTFSILRYACWSILEYLCWSPSPLCVPPAAASSSLSISPCFCFCLWPTFAGCLEVLLIRMCRVFNFNNSTIFFNGKFAPAHFFKALGENPLLKHIHHQWEHVNVLLSSQATCSTL